MNYSDKIIPKRLIKLGMIRFCQLPILINSSIILRRLQRTFHDSSKIYNI